MRSCRKSGCTVVLLLAFLAATVPSRADTIGYWQLGDGTPGSVASALVSQVNSPGLDGIAGTRNGGPTPLFNMGVPGRVIVDGLGGAVLNASNTVSLAFDNTGGPDSRNGGKVTVTDPGGVGSFLKPESFTLEAFIHVNDWVNYASVISKNYGDENSSWMLDTTNTDRIRARFDTADANNQTLTGPAVPINDGEWHHVSLTYDVLTGIARLFVDYDNSTSRTITGALRYNDYPLTFGNLGGGRAFDGLIDEVRLTNQVLTPSQFLHAIPEPGTLLLLAAGGLMFLPYRRCRGR